MVWYVEKEFNIGGIINDDFPILKLFNIFEESNIEKYKQINKTNTGRSSTKTVR